MIAVIAVLAAHSASADWRVISTESHSGIVTEADNGSLMLTCDGDNMIVALTLEDIDAEPDKHVAVDLRLYDKDPFTTYWIAGSTGRTIGLTERAEAFPAALYFADVQTLGVEVGEIAAEFDVSDIGGALPELACYE